jgi:UDP-N-acetylmuramate dehydrogenase
MRAREHVPLAPLTTLRLGGSAARVLDVDRESDLAGAVAEADAAGKGLLVLGGGSNLVVADEGFPGVVVRIEWRGVDVEREGERVVVDVAAGEDWDAFVARAVAERWRGVECMSGIPGRVGATPVQNVGAYGQEVSDTLVSVRVYDRSDSAFHTLPAAACAFGYRSSAFKRDDRRIVTSVRFAFDVAAGGESAPVRYAELARALGVAEGRRSDLATVRDTVVALRRRKGMVLDPDDPESVSAGSFFVNPVVGAGDLSRIEARAGKTPPTFPLEGPGVGPRYKIAAAWLVEQAGFPKGWGPGAVGVSRKHALALVHRGGGTTRELLAVARSIRDGVRSTFGVELEPEPVLVGCPW